MIEEKWKKMAAECIENARLHVQADEWVWVVTCVGKQMDDIDLASRNEIIVARFRFLIASTSNHSTTFE